MARRTFDAWLSTDKGQTWKKVRSTGWPISDIQAQELPDDYGYAIVIDKGDIMVDIGVPEKMFKLMVKDIDKLKQSDETLMGRIKNDLQR